MFGSAVVRRTADSGFRKAESVSLSAGRGELLLFIAELEEDAEEEGVS